MVLFLNVNFKYYRAHFNEFRNPTTYIPANTYDAFSITGWAFAPLPKKISAFVFANYQSQITNAQGTSVTPFFYGVGARKEMGNHTIGLFYLLPGITYLPVSDNKVNSSGYDNKTKVTTYSSTEMKASFDARYFIQLSYSYKFSKGKAAKKIVKDIEVESDTKKGGIGQ